MRLSEDGLKVFYKGGHNQELDDAIEKALKSFGYSMWASGMVGSEIRDLAFDKKDRTDLT